MSKIWLIVKRTYLQEARTKWFIITLSLPIIGLIITKIVVSLAIKDKFSNLFLFKKPIIGIIDHSNMVEKELIKEKDYIFKPVSKDEKLIQKVLDGEMVGYIEINKNILDTTDITFSTKDIGNYERIEHIEKIVNTAITNIRLQKSGLSIEKLAKIKSKAELKLKRITPGGEKKEERGVSTGFAYVMLFALYMLIIASSGTLGRNIVEEKENKVIEIIISSIKPFHLMCGKLFAVGGVGFTLLLAWLLPALLFVKFGKKFLGIGQFPEIQIPASIIFYFLIMFILGYFLFASFIMIFVATTSTEREANQSLIVPIFLLIFAFFMGQGLIMGSTDTLVATILSLIPFFTPLLMPVRIAVGSPKAWEIGVSFFLLLGSIGIMTWVSAKIYRLSILMYGKRLNIKELFKWIRYS